MTTKKNDVDLDAILIEVGEFGRFQMYSYCLIVLPILYSAIYASQYIFSVASVDYRCLVPECDTNESPNYGVSWWEMALPEASQARCYRFEPVNVTSENATCHSSSFGTNTVSCDRWVYANYDSIFSEFGLACQEWKRTLVGTIRSLGNFAALPLTGYISDRFGRRITLCITSVCAAVFGIVRSFATSYEFYVSFEFLEAMFGSGVYSTGFLLALELVGPSKRVLGGNIISVFFALGQVVLSLFAWWQPYWRTLTRILYAPSLLFFVYYFILIESVRWLLSKGKKKEAVEIIKRVAKTNKKTLSKTALATLELQDNATDTEKVKDKPLVLQVFKSKVMLIRLFVCSFWWITATFVYYGLSINSVSLAGNSYMNFILSSLIEIPGYALSVICLDRFGRKPSIMTAYLICGVSLMIMPFVPSSLAWLSTVLSMVGKLSISMTFSSIYIYTSELFPTYTRHSLLGFCSMVGRIGSILAPQTPLLAFYLPSLPYILFGSFAIASGVLMMLTPETFKTKLPDTIEEAENISNLKVNISKKV